MKTELLEFPNNENQNIRGILTLPDKEAKKAIIYLHGFERCATTEKKFKTLSDTLTKKMATTLRFDFSGCGLSDGDFSLTTIDKQGGEFLKAFEELKKKIGNNKISVVAHSLGACVLANELEKIKPQLEKIIFISPALNQKELLKYWFVISQTKKSNPNIKITWQNYKKYFDKNAFTKDCERNDKTTKANYIQANYFLQAKDIDFSEKFRNINLDILHIHGTKDVSVPIESLNIKFKNQIIIEKGDHDLEKPNIINQWKDKVIDFLLK